MRAFIDSVSDGTARLLFGDEETMVVLLPVALLPRGAKEGDVLDVRMRIDAGASEAGKKRVEKLLGELGDEP